jgi:glutathione peroxidase
MTETQKLLKLIYPILALINKIRNNKMQPLQSNTKANESFYDLKMKQNSGKEFSFSDLKNKKIIIVNTASACGYTPQYDGLQKLYENNKSNLMILGFPANDFKEQEKGTDEEIAQFCKLNYGVTFPLAKKSAVIPGPDQNPVFQWLTDKNKNGWTSKKPSWNFSKYLINEKGVLVNYFDPTISPTGKEVTEAIKK